MQPQQGDKVAKEDFDSYWTIEFNGNKGWEVIQKYEDTHKGEVEAKDDFNHYLEDTKIQWRLTSPK